MMYSETDKTFKMNAHHVSLRTREGVRRGGARRELKKRGRGMKDRVDKSMGLMIVTLILRDLRL